MRQKCPYPFNRENCFLCTLIYCKHVLIFQLNNERYKETFTKSDACPSLHCRISQKNQSVPFTSRKMKFLENASKKEIQHFFGTPAKFCKSEQLRDENFNYFFDIKINRDRSGFFIFLLSSDLDVTFPWKFQFDVILSETKGSLRCFICSNMKRKTRAR